MVTEPVGMLCDPRICGAVIRLAMGVALAVAIAPDLRAQTDLTLITRLAEDDDPEALNLLGNAYASGSGVARDFDRAVELFNRSSELGYGPASFNLGLMYELGRGVPIDLNQAFQFYLRAATQGFAPAQFNVGNMYARGIGTGADQTEAVVWFRQAAEQGVPDAQFNLAVAYESGQGVSADLAAARRWYREASDQGYSRASYNLAVMLEEDSLTRISLRYYGTPTRWQDIYQANRELLSEANALRPGQQLRIP